MGEAAVDDQGHPASWTLEGVVKQYDKRHEEGWEFVFVGISGISASFFLFTRTVED